MAAHFHGGKFAGVVHAEDEDDDEDRQVRLPTWSGDEVTGQPQHGKRALVEASTAPRRQTAA